MLEEMTDHLSTSDAWPALQRIEVGLDEEGDAVMLLTRLTDVCQRRGIELVPLIGSVALSALH